MRTGREKPSILIIDDTPDNLRVAVRHLEAYSFDILTARDGESGLARAKLVHPSLILLDVQMPGIDGYETCRRLKADPDTAAIPVIFMTVLSEPADKVRGFEAGGVDYVIKPLEATELLARVRAHLQIRALQAELEQHASELEDRVADRTAALERELAQRAAHQKEREQLLELVRMQSEQLRRLTQQWIDEQRERDRGLAQTLQARVTSRLSLVGLHLAQARHLAAGEGSGTAGEALRGHLDVALDLLDPALEETRTVSGSLDQPAPPVMRDNPLLRLSTREYEVLQLMAAGKSNKEIAWMLDVARTTVSTYRLRIMEKLEVEDMASLLKLAIQYEVDRPAPQLEGDG